MGTLPRLYVRQFQVLSKQLSCARSDSEWIPLLLLLNQVSKLQLSFGFMSFLLKTQMAQYIIIGHKSVQSHVSWCEYHGNFQWTQYRQVQGHVFSSTGKTTGTINQFQKENVQ